MALGLINTQNVGDNGTLQLGGASYVTTAVVGGTTYVFVTGKGNGDNGVSVFSLGTDGTLTNVDNVADNATMNLGGAFALTTAVVGGVTYLFAAGVNDSGVSAFSVGADGHLTNVDNVADNATLKLALTTDVETMVVGGTTYLFSGGVNDNGVSVFAVGADGKLTNVDNVIDDGTSNIQGPQGLATATVGGNAYLFVTGFHDDGVGVYSVAADGHLTNVFNVRDTGPMELDGPVDAITVAVGGTTYLVVSGFEDDGLTVFSVAADGHLTNVFNLPDDGTLKLDNPVGLSTTVLNGKTYLFVAGADDDGLSVFAVGNDGALTNVTNVSDNATLLLDRVIGVTTIVVGGQTYVIAASNNDSGVSVFRFNDDTNHEPTLSATGNNPAFTEGGAAVDIFSAPSASTADPGQSFTSLTLTVTNVTDGANEILSFLGHELALTNGNAVAGVTVSITGTTATVTFPGAADAAALQALIDGLAYRNASQNPTEADRVVTITRLSDSGGTAGGGDDTAALNIVSTVHVGRTNDAAIISGDTAGDVTEAGVNNGTPAATGDLNSADVDNAADAWQAVAGAASANGYGAYALTANGVWTYTLDNANTTVQALNDGDTLTDTFTVLTADGTAQLVTVTIHGQNDAATITGTASGDVTEAGINNGTPAATGDLNSADPDNAADAWQAVAAGAASVNGFGTFALTANGVWTYTLDNANTTVQALNDGDTLTDTFTVLTQDGTAQLVTVTINGANDAATITGDAVGAVNASGNQTDTGDLNAIDPDNTADAWQAVAAGAASANGYGTFALTANGVWTYTLDNANATVQALKDGDTLTDTFTVLTQDGTAQLVTVTINGANDAATITGDAAGAVTASGNQTDTGDLNAIDPDNTADAWQAVPAGAASANGYGTFALTANGVWTYTLDNANATVQALKDGDTLTDTFTVLTQDGTAQLVTVTINGANDAATITGDAAGTVTASGNQTDTGDLNAIDPDNTADAWQAVAAGAASANGYGTFALTANGVWTYTLDSANAAVQALKDGDTLTDTFTVLTQDGTAQVITVTINGANDAATITGTAAGNVTEAGINNGTPAATGDLNSADVDNVADAWQAVAAGAATAHGFGTYAVTVDGQWTYTLDNANATVQALKDGDTLTDTFTVLTQDGTAQVVTVTINGANDAATITGTAAGNVTEAGINNGTPAATGDLNSADVDNPNDTWQAVAPGTGTIGGFGTYAVTADGQWTYTLDNSNAAVHALNGAATLTDTFNVVTADGTTQLVTITIHAQNDAAIITGDAAGAVTASGNQTDTGDLNAADPDNAADSWQAVAAGAATAHGYGTYALTANGVWTYTLDSNNAAVQALHAGDTLTDTFTVLTQDGTAQLVTVTINGGNDAPPIDPNDAPVNTVPGTQVLDVNHTLSIAGLAVSDPDAGAAAITTSLSVAHGTLTVDAFGGVAVAGSGTSTVTLTGSVAQINAALAAAGNVVYAPSHDFAGADTLTMTTNDRGNSGNGGALSDTDVVTINVNAVDNPHAPVIGTPGDDSFTASPGNQRIDAFGGVDTITFDFKLVDASVSHVGNTVVIDGPNSHTVLTGVERFVFTDGTVDNHDGDVLVDDLFYYAHNHDVWTSHADADAHYHQFGWHEGRDPNALFSTSTYLALNPAVRASGADPLVQFDQGGWKTALSIGFDVNAYLSANPDVKAAGVDPLAHFLGNGAQEGRQPFVPSVLLASNGFDYVYYLQHNPDVAAAHVDPFQHFETIGWKEGRNPNALFDTNQYLAAYADVKASGINPLDHYNEFGWHEGRDPSGGFDTGEYLSHNPDVAASQINPLSHFLQFGQLEARSPFADGHLG